MDDIKCNSISVYQEIQGGFFGGPYYLELCDNGINIHVHQMGIRKTIISSEKEKLFSELFHHYTRLDRLMMIFEGEFYPITQIETTTSGNTDILNLDVFQKNRISAYNSSPEIKGNHSTLLSPFSYIDNKMIDRWCQLDNELDIVHQMYLYNLSDNGFPADGKVAFMIECFEPLSELISAHNQFSLISGIIKSRLC